MQTINEIKDWAIEQLPIWLNEETNEPIANSLSRLSKSDIKEIEAKLKEKTALKVEIRPTKNKRYFIYAEKIDWKKKMHDIKKNHFEIYEYCRCPECGAKAIITHRYGVLRAICENSDWHESGFGGPNSMSWNEACAWNNIPIEEQRKIKQKRENEMKQKYEKALKFVLSE